MYLNSHPVEVVSRYRELQLQLGENYSYSVKRSDVTRWKQGYKTPPPPYFILWNSVTSLGENKVI